MSRSRSPNYPQIGLKEAIQRVSSVYKRDYQASLTRDLAAERLGYSGLNGKSLAVLAALGKFGLLEGRGEETRVSDLAVRMLAFPPGSPERRAALEEAAGRPELFVELDQRFARAPASDAAIRAWLITRGFIPPAAEAAVRAYRETRQLLEAEGEADIVICDRLLDGRRPYLCRNCPRRRNRRRRPRRSWPGRAGRYLDWRKARS